MNFVAADPNDGAGLTLYAGTDDGVYRTFNAGTSWSKMSFTPVAAEDIYTRSVAVAANNLVVGSWSARMFRSTTLGASWTTLAATGQTSGTQVLALALGGLAGEIYAGHYGAGALYKSTNSGTSWTQLTAYPGGGNVGGIATFAGGGNVYVGGNGTGVYRSTNGGASFNAASVGLDNPAVRDIVQDPSDATRLYAATGGNGIYKTESGGQ